jgi:hypothetical protein
MLQHIVPMRVQHTGFTVIACAALGLVGSTARSSVAAQSGLAGPWRAGATAIEVNVESWGGDCGPRPQSARSNGGGLVNVEQKEQALLLHGRDHDIRSDSCWSHNPAMKRTLAGYSSGVWTTRCRTSDTDPRAEQGTYTLKLSGPDTLQYQDVSRYDWSLNESKCVATFTTTQTLRRDEKSKAQKSAPTKLEASQDTTATTTIPVAAETRGACTPGPATRLSVRPKRAEIEVGKRICFRARISDAADCTIPQTAVHWELAHAKALRGSINDDGCFYAAESATDAQGEYRVIAKVEGLSADALVTVRPVDLSALIATRMEGSGLNDEEADNPQVATPAKTVARIDTHANTPAAAPLHRRGLLFGLGGVAIALTLLGWALSRRATPAAVSGSLPPPSSTSGDTPSASVPVSVDPPSVEATVVDEAPASVEPFAETWICPSCRVGYPALQHTCPKDGTTLITYAEFIQRGRRDDAEHAKRCPNCGQTYPASASFCGSDGAGLVDA